MTKSNGETFDGTEFYNTTFYDTRVDGTQTEFYNTTFYDTDLTGCGFPGITPEQIDSLATPLTVEQLQQITITEDK